MEAKNESNFFMQFEFLWIQIIFLLYIDFNAFQIFCNSSQYAHMILLLYRKRSDLHCACNSYSCLQDRTNGNVVSSGAQQFFSKQMAYLQELTHLEPYLFCFLFNQLVKIFKSIGLKLCYVATKTFNPRNEAQAHFLVTT